MQSETWEHSVPSRCLPNPSPQGSGSYAEEVKEAGVKDDSKETKSSLNRTDAYVDSDTEAACTGPMKVK